MGDGDEEDLSLEGKVDLGKVDAVGHNTFKCLGGDLVNRSDGLALHQQVHNVLKRQFLFTCTYQKKKIQVSSTA